MEAIEEEMISNTVVKPLFTIHMSNDLTLFERKVMNTLIKHIHNIESTENKEGKYITPQGNYYEFTFDKIEEWLELDKYHQRRDIVKALTQLMTTVLRFNTLKRDNRKFKDIILSTLLAGVRFKESFEQEQDSTEDSIENSKIYFAFSPFIVEAILNPIPYAQLSFTEQNKIVSKHSLALFEFLKAELNTHGKDEVLSQIVSVKNYEALVAGRKSEYAFKDVNKELVKKPLKEINNKTSIKASAILHKTGRSVSGIQFSVKKEYFSGEEKENMENLPLFSSFYEKQNNLKNDLLKYGVSPIIAGKIIDEYDYDCILSNLSYCLGRNIISPGYIVSSIQQNYAGRSATEKLETEMPETAEQLLLKQKLVDIKMSIKQASIIVRSYDLGLIKANFDFLQSQEKYKNKITPPLLLTAIKDNYSNYGCNVLTSESQLENKPFKIVFSKAKKEEMKYINETILPFLKEFLIEGLEEIVENINELTIFSCDLQKIVFFTENTKTKNIIFLHFQNRFESNLKRAYRKYFKESLSSYQIIDSTDISLEEFRIYEDM